MSTTNNDLDTRLRAVETKVSAIEAVQTIIHADIASLRTTLWGVAVTIVGAMFMMMVAGLLYFLAQKDDVIQQLSKAAAHQTQ